MIQLKRLEYARGHRLFKTHPRWLDRQHAKQTDTGVGVQAFCAWGPLRLPVLVEPQQGRPIGHVIGHLQRQTACGVGRQVQQSDALPLLTRQLWPVFACGIVKLDVTACDGFATQNAGKGFAYGTQLKHGALSDWLIRGDIRLSVDKIVRLSLINHGDGHAWDRLFFHERRHNAIDGISDLFVSGRGGKRRA
ncbi:hypothetical protein D3C78_686520 [compost metagenome]